MESLEASLERARSLDVGELAEAIQAIGFECTRCGRCCTADGDDPHTATIFPDEIRAITEHTGAAWEDVARPMPYGVDDRGEGETFEWALQTDACGDCRFLESVDENRSAGVGESAVDSRLDDDGEGADDSQPAGDGRTVEEGGTACSIYEDRPLICQTYPFSVALAGTDEYATDVVATEGVVQAHTCPGLGRDIDEKAARALAETLRRRAIREIEEAIGVREQYESPDGDYPLVVHDSEGAKRADGTPIEAERDGNKY